MYYESLPVERVYHGVHVVKHYLKQEIDRLKAMRILIVSTKSVEKQNVFQDLLNYVSDSDFMIIHTKDHTPANVLMEPIGEIRDFQPDLILSCGGGSSIDGGKALSLILKEGIETEDEFFEYSIQGKSRTPNLSPRIPHIAIPTTLSGAEFTCLAGVTNHETKMKHLFVNPALTPFSVFLDPVYTVGTPEWLWLTSGIRAVDHAVETLYSPKPQPINSGLAMEALNCLYHFLPLSKNDPSDLQARVKCQQGAWMSLFSINNIKMGLSHMIGHQLGSHYGIPHGGTSAIVLPHVMEFLLPQTKLEQARITERLGYEQKELSMQEKAERAANLVRELVSQLGIPSRLRDYNVPVESIPKVIDDIMIEVKHTENPLIHQTCTREKLQILLEGAW
ncbi:iron-containing alcohol dehydrogenase [Paenibacillus sp. BSR1-1]|uniref:iron-containing alcohol dehydrogenase n=1 Tax=Paenibacillus sp. BSR1-1 TaxID=3020845 RepID=UPI0025B17F7B|nr:iron-containing alcohol dehydrogenase [Paenibacillus sp. BSR1-1]MDN3016197.1 iron-containing alcohol dehydrogenase [Paenibacillus sp. BSR1-1]